jgi:nickel/cobalt transporter (NiCoT) family protein
VRAGIVAIYGLILVANGASWLWAWMLFADRPVPMSAAVLVYILGLRHALDADHIAAIDNVVRRLIQDSQKPVATGFFFSLGHSTVVLLAVVAVALTATALGGEFGDIKAIAAVAGKLVSALLLLVIGGANLVALVALWKALRNPYRPSVGADALSGPAGGVLARICAPIFRTISRSWLMFPLGFLFGLSFETATEVGLLGVSASQAGPDQSAWSILVFPALFASSMTLIDTTDGVLMVEAYGWALIDPLRKIWYNFAMTFASVAVAVFIGVIQIVGMLVDRMQLDGPAWQAIADFGNDLTTFGLAIVGIFMTTWLVSALLYRRQRIGAVITDPA